MVKKVVGFFSEDLWRVRLAELSPWRSLGLRSLRVVVLSLRQFDEDKCMLRASALTFYTLLSIVPVLAMAFGIAKGFNFEDTLEHHIRHQFNMSIELRQGPPEPGPQAEVVLSEGLGPMAPAPVVDISTSQQQVLDQVIVFAHKLLENTQGGAVAGIGVALLFWTVIKLLSTIERSFNDIWGIQKPRSLFRKFSDYLSFMLICPLLLILANGSLLYVGVHLEEIMSRTQFLGDLARPVRFLMGFAPLLVLWLAFMFMYMFLPNGRVRPLAALIGAAVAGSLYQIIQWVYITFQVGVAKYNAVYGSFSALPLFLIWLQLSWLIVLYGAEIAFACQNVQTYEFEKDCLRVSAARRRLVLFSILHLCAVRFRNGDAPAGALDIAQELATPIRLVRQCLEELRQAGLLTELVDPEGRKAVAYQPAMALDRLRLSDVIGKLESSGVDAVPLSGDPAIQRLDENLRVMAARLSQGPEDIRLEEL